jgi:sugar/nucleoside kinase (ribokinase family)
MVDPSPLAGDVPLAAWRALAGRGVWWTLNLREARILARRLGLAPPGGTDPPGGAARDGLDGVKDAARGPEPDGGASSSGPCDPAATLGAAGLAASLQQELGGSVVVRLGALGAVVDEDGKSSTWVAAHPVQAVDTNGAGDAHAGVMAAALLRGLPLVDAVRRANVAAALSVTRAGPATAPSAQEIDAALRRG